MFAVQQERVLYLDISGMVCNTQLSFQHVPDVCLELPIEVRNPLPICGERDGGLWLMWLFPPPSLDSAIRFALPQEAFDIPYILKYI